MRTRVKICGFTRVDDAVAAAKLGVDAIGLVFYSASPRHVSITQAQAIVRALPAFTTVVGLFVDEHETMIRDILAQVPLDCLQFHGDEPPAACRLYGRPYLKALRIKPGMDVAELAASYHDATGLLLDAYHDGAKGGTGQCFDWDLIPAQLPLPVILAGGLEPGNVETALTAVRPYALDVSSGVESAKGVKDPAKMAAFITAVNNFKI